MFSKEESKKLRKEFWTSFGKKFPKKWILYNTKIKGLELKFTFTTKTAKVSIDCVSSDELFRFFYFEKITSLRTILTSEYLPNAIFAEEYELPEGKTISRIYVELENVTIHNKNHWPVVMDFLNQKMSLLEAFFIEYKDFIEN